MADRMLSTLFEGGTFFEGPRWHQDHWWVSDFYRQRVFRLTTDGREEEILEVPGQPSGLGWLPDGSMLVVSMRDRRLLRRFVDGRVVVHAGLDGILTGHANDMVVDAKGRAWVGCFGFDLMGGADPKAAPLARVDPDGKASLAASDLLFPNGSVVPPDEKTLIVGESFGCRYTAFTIGDDGTLSDRRIWAELAPAPAYTTLEETFRQMKVAPDGCALDAEGHIWAADALGGRAIRVAPGNGIVDEIAMPDGLQCFACMLGGSDGRTLLLCAAPDFHEEERKKAREAVLLTTTVDAPHAGLP